MRLEFLGGSRDGTVVRVPNVGVVVERFVDGKTGERWVPVSVERGKGGKRVKRVVYQLAPGSGGQKG